MTRIRNDFFSYLERSRLNDPVRRDYQRQLIALLKKCEKRAPGSRDALCEFLDKFSDYQYSLEEEVMSSEDQENTINSEYLAAIVCALKDPEADAVIKLLTNEHSLHTKSGTPYLAGAFEYEDGYRPNIAVFFQTHMGPVESAATTAEALANIQAKYLFMAGVCGGRAKDGVNLADILVASKAVTYQTGEYLKNSFRPEPRVALSDNRLIDLIRMHKNKIENLVSQSTPTDLASRLSVRIGTFLCGDAIINEEEMIEDLVAQLDRRIIGVDMESYGFLRACEKIASSDSQAIVIKGVMDVCSDREKNRDKLAASYVSARAIYELIGILGRE